jgi:EAL domain-containing protein (putative c-di-GMP-specific phosphodiesterase class I)
MELENVLDAISAGEFFVVYQPKYNVREGRITGLEALIRWGKYSPSDFLPVLEAGDTKLSLLKFVIQQVAKDMLTLNEFDVTMSINITPIDLSHPDVLQVIIKEFLDNKIDHHRIVFEITETYTMKENQNAQNVISMLHYLGFNISIDDFGTGHSCFNYLKYFPVHELKIDKLFITDMVENKFDRYLVKSLIDLCKNFNWKSVAEGVEDLKTLLMLEEMGVDEIQGYYFSEPLRLDEVIFIIKDCYDAARIKAGNRCELN